MQIWNTVGLLESGLPHIPSYMTDLNRASLLEDEAVSKAVQTGMEHDGSNTGILFVDQLSWENGKKGWLRKSPSILTIGAKQADIIGKLLRGRLLKNRKLTLSGPESRIVFEAGEQSGYSAGDDEVRIVLDEHTVTEMSNKLRPKQSEFNVSAKDGFMVRIVQTNITDQDGRVVKTIG